MEKNYKLLIFFIVAGILLAVIGSTFAYWRWSTNSAQNTAVTFTVSSDFSCSADGGGNITSSDKILAPATCTDTTYAIRRTVVVDVTKNGGQDVYLDLKLKVNSIAAELSASENFKYALTTSSSSCTSNVIATGTFNGTTANSEKSLLNNKQYAATNHADTYYLWIWLDKEETNLNTMNQTFNMTLSGSCTDEEPAAITAPWGETVDRYTKVNFSQTSVQNNTNGLYLFKPTANDTNPVYYYRGNVNNNNVLFGGFCWKIVRTTSTGGTKLIYNGVPSNGQCTATTGTDTQLASTTKFNTNYSSPADVGYMYGTRYAYTSMSSANRSTSYKYGNSVIWNGTNYTLVDTIDTTGTWSSDYNTLNNNHYTCLNATGTCTSVYYVYYTSSSSAYYITLTNGKTVENALDEMLTSSTNATSSTIKSTLDTWYSTNLTSYTSNLEDTIWCNDREIYQLGGFDPNGGNTTQYLYFNPYGRVTAYYSPSITCRSNDAFTVSSSIGNGKLTNPVGLLTADEIMMTGGKSSSANSSYYLYTNQAYWAGSPYYFNYSYAIEWIVNSSGYLGSDYVSNTHGARPAVSLKPGATWSGSGTSSSPYTVSWS